MTVAEHQPIPLMDIDQLEDIAFNGGPMPELRSQAQCVLFQAFRNLYSYAKRVNMSPAQGRREKNEILKAYEINRFLEDMQEKDIQTRKRVELAAAEYAKNPSVETADKFYEAFYRVKRKKAEQ